MEKRTKARIVGADFHRFATEIFPFRHSTRSRIFVLDYSDIPLMLINFYRTSRRAFTSARIEAARKKIYLGGGAEFPGERARFYLSLELLTGCEGSGGGIYTGCPLTAWARPFRDDTQRHAARLKLNEN